MPITDPESIAVIKEKIVQYEKERDAFIDEANHRVGAINLVITEYRKLIGEEILPQTENK